MQDSIFTKIIKGEVPAHKIYEDARTFVFLTIKPVAPGHTLVVPKLQVDSFDDLPDDDYQALFRTVRKVSRHLRTTLGVKRTIMQAFGFDVPHVHIHLVPAEDSHQFLEAMANDLDHKPYAYRPTPGDLAAVAERLRMEDER